MAKAHKGANPGKNLKPPLAPKAQTGLSRKLPPFMASGSPTAKKQEAGEKKRVKNALAFDGKRNQGKR